MDGYNNNILLHKRVLTHSPYYSYLTCESGRGFSAESPVTIRKSFPIYGYSKKKTSENNNNNNITNNKDTHRVYVPIHLQPTVECINQKEDIQVI